MSGLAPNTLYYGDCLDWMGKWDAESVNLVYLDPPFDPKADYNVLYGTEGSSEAQYRAFEGTWHWDDKAENRLAMFESAIGRLAHNVYCGAISHPWSLRNARLSKLYGQAIRAYAPTLEAFRLAVPNTVIQQFRTNLKVVLDAIFGAQGFRTEITRQRTSSHNDGTQGRKQYGRICESRSIRGVPSGRGIGNI